MKGESMKKIKQFIKESYLEFKKVRWPSRQELASLTVAVIATTLLLAFFIGIVDWVFSKIVSAVLP